MYLHLRKKLSWGAFSILALGFDCFLSIVTPANAVPLYATGTGTGPGAGLSALYTVDPLTGASSLIWNFPSIHIYAGGLAYDATTDTLYATGVEDSSTDTSRLFTIDYSTGATTFFPGLGSDINLSLGGLAINPLTGVMYATGSNGFQSTALFTIDKNTGAATLVGQAASGCCIHLYGLGFRGDGTLFANGNSETPTSTATASPTATATETPTAIPTETATTTMTPEVRSDPGGGGL